MLVARVGVEPTDSHEGLSFAAFPFAYRAIELSNHFSHLARIDY